MTGFSSRIESIRKDIVRLFTEERMSVKEVADELKTSPPTVRRVLRDEGIDSKRKFNSHTEVKRDKIVMMFKHKRMSRRQIASELGMTDRTVSKVLEDEGVCLPNKHIPANTEKLVRQMCRVGKYPMNRIAEKCRVSRYYVWRIAQEVKEEIAELEDKVVEMYTKSGGNLRDIAVELGISQRFVERMLNDREIPRKHKLHSRQFVSDVLNLHKIGYSRMDIADILNVDYSIIQSILYARGYKTGDASTRTPVDADKVVELWNEGRGVREICKLLDATNYTIRKILNDRKVDSDVPICKACGKKMQTRKFADRYDTMKFKCRNCNTWW